MANDRELSIAGVYSKAMLDLAEQQGASDSLLEELQGLVEYLDRNPELERFLASPLVEDEDRGRVLEKAFRGKTSDLLLDSLQVINRKGRLGLLRGIVESYSAGHRELRGLVETRVRTAVPLTEALRARVRDAVARHTGRTPVLVETVDPSLLGGIVIQVGDEKIDGSVAQKLRELGRALELRASQEIVRSRSYVQQ
ncbi:MAG: ATP synthase F1 subunit delta [Acidobacteriota bacterium]